MPLSPQFAILCQPRFGTGPSSASCEVRGLNVLMSAPSTSLADYYILTASGTNCLLKGADLPHGKVNLSNFHAGYFNLLDLASNLSTFEPQSHLNTLKLSLFGYKEILPMLKWKRVRLFTCYKLIKVCRLSVDTCLISRS